MVEYCEFLNFAGKLLPPFHDFLLLKALFKIVLGQNFFNCEPIFKIFAAHFRTN